MPNVFRSEHHPSTEATAVREAAGFGTGKAEAQGGGHGIALEMVGTDVGGLATGGDSQVDGAVVTGKTVGELQGAPASAWGAAWGMDDIITGLQFSATMQLRTPLRVLKWHGHVHEDRNSPPPSVIREPWEGVWLPKTKSLREMGIDLDLPESTMASDIGYVPADGGDYLRFLIAVHKVVEGEESVASRVEALEALAGLPEWSAFVEKLSYRSSLVDYFFPPFLRTIPRLGQAAQSKLAEKHLDSPSRLAAASDETLLAVKGIGPATLKAIRSRCAECSGAGDEARIDGVKR